MNQGTKSTQSHGLILIPAAGYGTRMGSPPAKEILHAPDTQSPLIERALSLTKKLGCRAHVITRKEKTSLIEYVIDYSNHNHLETTIQIVNPTREWPEAEVRARSTCPTRSRPSRERQARWHARSAWRG